MIDGKVKGYFLLGQNPAVGSAHGRLQRLGHGQPGLAGGPRPDHDRERHLLAGRPGDRDRRDRAGASAAPRCSSSRPPRTWRRRAPSPTPSGCCSGGRRRSSRPGDQRSELWFFYHLGRLIRERLAGVDRPARPAGPRPDLGLPDGGRDDEPSAEAVLREINGYDGRTGSRCPATPSSRPTAPPPAAAGSTAASTPTGSTRRPGASRAHEQDWTALEWGWAWPCNRRILYNRASADPEGRPWSERKAYVWWDEAAGRVDRPRRARLRDDQAAVVPAAAGRGRAGRAARRRPVHHAGRRQGLAVRAERAAGRPAAHPLRAARVAVPQRAVRPAGQPDPQGLRPRRTTRPTRRRRSEHADVFPYVLTTYRLTEHHTAGGDEPAACRTWPSCSRRCSSRCPRSWPRERGLEHLRLGARWSPAGARSRPGSWSPTGCGRCGSGPDRAPGLAALPLGLHRAGHRRRGQRPVRHRARPERADPGEQGDHLRRPARPPAAGTGAAGAAWTVTGGGPASPSSTGTSGHHRSGSRPAAPGDRARRRSAERTASRTRWTTSPRRPATPTTRRGWASSPTPRLHRLQGLRGGLQGVEPRPGRRASTCSACRTTTPARSAPTPGGTSRSSSSRAADRAGTPVDLGMPSFAPPGAEDRRPRPRQDVPLADGLRRVQALHPRRLPGRLPDRGAVPHRVRHGRRAAGHLQRLRLLRLRPARTA